MPPLVLRPEEAVAVGLGATLVEEMWGALYRDAARAALTKLDALLPDDQRQEITWARRSLLAAGLQRPGIEAAFPALELLRSALRQTRRVKLIYETTGKAEPTRRDFETYTLVYRWGRWYAAGFCRLRQAMRLLRLDRIREVTLLEERYEIPADYDPRAFLEASLQPAPALLARLRFAPQAAGFVRDASIGWSNIAELPDGSLEATLPAADLQFAASMAISFGPLVTILEPQELVALVKDWARGIVDRYPE